MGNLILQMFAPYYGFHSYRIELSGYFLVHNYDAVAEWLNENEIVDYRFTAYGIEFEREAHLIAFQLRWC